MKKFSAQDRSALIRFASTLPKGSSDRRMILGGLQRLAEKKQIDPKEIFTALDEISKDPKKYGVKEEDLAQIEKLSETFEPIFGAKGGEKKKKKSSIHREALDLSGPLGMAVSGVKLMTKALGAVRKFTEDVGVPKETVNKFFLNTVGVAYAAAALGAAAVLSKVAPEHPIAAHAQKYEELAEETAKDVPVIEKMTEKVEHVVQNMGDKDMDKSLDIISNALVKTKLMSPPPVVPSKVVQKSLDMHHALQDFHDVIQGYEVGTSMSKSNRPSEEGKGTYGEYVERKKKEGEKPISKKEWEARYSA